MFRTVCICRGEGIGLVKIRKDLNSIFLGTEVGKDPVEMFLHIERTYLNLIAIEGHEVRLDAKSTSLIQTTTAAAGTKFAQIGDVHLTKGVQVQII